MVENSQAFPKIPLILPKGSTAEGNYRIEFNQVKETVVYDGKDFKQVSLMPIGNEAEVKHYFEPFEPFNKDKPVTLVIYTITETGWKQKFT